MMKSNRLKQSEALYARAKQSIPGGVNSPVRAFKSVGGSPVFMSHAIGAYMFDSDNNDYVDFINSWGPMILGHNHPEVVRSIQDQAKRAISFGTSTELEIAMAELIKKMVPNVDLIRLVSSGTEACMSALRLARGYTGRNKFIKFNGNYHGHADPFLVKAGSGLATFDIQEVPGVTKGVQQDTLICHYNDLDTVTKVLEEQHKEIAAIILEPVCGNMGCIPPNEGFLSGLRALCNKYNVVLIFDEVMTGFRLKPGGAQELFHVYADLITYGKVIGGGLPVAAFGGKREVMSSIAPLGNVYQAGTLSGNPIAVSAGYKTLKILDANRSFYDKLDGTTTILARELSKIWKEKGINHTINRVGSMMSLHFTNNKVTNFSEAANCDQKMFNNYFHHMLKNGVYLPPSMYESWFISLAIGEREIDRTLEATRSFLK